MAIRYTPPQGAQAKRHVDQRLRYLGATLVTCIVLTLIGGTVHVLQLGQNRMEDMRSKITYDAADIKSRVRAAGQDLFLLTAHEYGIDLPTYTVEEAEALLTPEQWRELETMVEIPAGSFIMGTDLPRTDLQNQPQHVAEVGAFLIDKYPVTNAQYARFVAETGHRPPLHWKGGKMPEGREFHPVVMVSWFDASRYAAWAGKRLPTEKEWERAARGQDGRRWPWGDRMDPVRLNTYYQVGATTEVLRFPEGASPDGVMDMAGNISEWVADDFMPYPGSTAPSELFIAKMPSMPRSPAERSMGVADFIELSDDRYKILRGGSWKSDPFSTSVFHRNFSLPNMASDFYGFRCAQDVD